MTMVEPVAIITEETRTYEEGRAPYVQWGPVVGGALTAAAFMFVLHMFAAAIGLAVSWAAPTWRDSSFMLALLSGLYLVFAAIIAFGVGGYLVGRMRSAVGGNDDEIEFRDGSLGLLSWAIAIVLTVLLTWAAAQSLAKTVAPSGTGDVESVAGENLIAYDLDQLFRAERRPPNIDLDYARAEAARILLTSAGHAGVTPADRAYLIRLTAVNSGLEAPDAERRTDIAIAQTKEALRKARRSGMIIAFMSGAAALLGAAVAWFAACEGGRHRDGKVVSCPGISAAVVSNPLSVVL